MTQDVITVVLASKQIGLSETALRKKVANGEVEGFKLGRDWVVTAETLEQLRQTYPLQVAGGDDATS